MKLTSDFNAEEFVENLLSNGSKVTCDSTNWKYNEYKLPNDFDEEKFKRGQKFYNDNIFMLLIGKLSGLVTILSIPSILKILVYTRMSATPLSAYKRYMSTIFHMTVWYSEDFQPGSTMWRSMEDVRRKHNQASKRSSCIGANSITQLDMALTQFGFMGFAITHPSKIGLFNPEPVAYESWVYLWRVVGDLMGIEDQFNICRLSIEETRQVCLLLIERVFKEHIERGDSLFLEMAKTLINGMWAMQPFIRPDLTYVKVLRLISPGSQQFKDEFAMLDSKQKWYFNLEMTAINLCQYWFWRRYQNILMHITIWLMKYFPFLAIWKYGYKNAYVKILNDPVPIVRNAYKSG